MIGIFVALAAAAIPEIDPQQRCCWVILIEHHFDLSCLEKGPIDYAILVICENTWVQCIPFNW